METVQLTKEKVIAAYKSGTLAEKKLMEKLMGKEIFQAAAGRPETFDEAWKQFQKFKFTDRDFLIIQKRKKEQLTADEMLQIIACVIRGTWAADYSDGNQPKWFPVFKYDSKTAAFGFSHSGFDGVYSLTYCGSRFALETEEHSNYFGQKFLPLWNEYLLINHKPTKK